MLLGCRVLPEVVYAHTVTLIATFVSADSMNNELELPCGTEFAGFTDNKAKAPAMQSGSAPKFVKRAGTHAEHTWRGEHVSLHKIRCFALRDHRGYK